MAKNCNVFAQTVTTYTNPPEFTLSDFGGDFEQVSQS